MNDILETHILGNDVSTWLTAAGIFLAVVVVVKLFMRVFLGQMARLARRTDTSVDDYVVANFGKSVSPILYLAGLWFALNGLSMAPRWHRIVTGGLTILATFFVVRFLARLVTHALRERWMKQGDTEARTKGLAGLIAIINAGIWVLGLVFVIDNLGFQVSALVAGLGIGGIAVALAAQTILGDLFSYVSIFFDRPFEIGDFIQVDDVLGEVEYIGLKTTRLRSLGGEQIVIANSDLTNSRVRNYKRMAQRRIVFRIGVVYETDYEQLQEIPGILREIINAVDKTRFDRAHFASYGDFSLNFEVVYYVLSSDYTEYMNIQQAINLALFAEFEKRGLAFAYPTQKVYVDREA